VTRAQEKSERDWGMNEASGDQAGFRTGGGDVLSSVERGGREEVAVLKTYDDRGGENDGAEGVKRRVKLHSAREGGLIIRERTVGTLARKRGI